MLSVRTNVFILVISSLSVVHLEQMAKTVNNYGPYILSIDEFGSCKGPKANNLTIMSIKMEEHQSVYLVNISFLVDAKIEEIKVHVFNVNDNKKNFLWNYKFNDPCRHYAIAALIDQCLGAHSCYVQKGNYTNSVNLIEIMDSFLGNSFFYGIYSFKTVMTSKKGNIACFASKLTFKKKNL